MKNYLIPTLFLFLFTSENAYSLNKCIDLFKEKIYTSVFRERVKGKSHAEFLVEPSKPISQSDIKELSKIREIGGDGYHARITIRIENYYSSIEMAQKDIAKFNATKSIDQQFQIERFEDGYTTLIVRQYGVILETLPTHFSAEIKARHKELKENGIFVAIGNNLGISIHANGQAVVSNPFAAGRASGIILAKVNLTQLTLNHEMQHIYDMVLKTDKLFEEMPELPENVASIVKRAINKEPLTWVEKRRSDSALKFPETWSEAKASEQSMKDFFRLRGFKEMILPKGRYKELYVAWSAVITYSYRNLQLFYHQMWINPLNPRSIIFVFKAGVSGYVFVKATSIALQSGGYSIEYASSLIGLL